GLKTTSLSDRVESLDSCPFSRVTKLLTPTLQRLIQKISEDPRRLACRFERLITMRRSFFVQPNEKSGLNQNKQDWDRVFPQINTDAHRLAQIDAFSFRAACVSFHCAGYVKKSR